MVKTIAKMGSIDDTNGARVTMISKNYHRSMLGAEEDVLGQLLLCCRSPSS